MCAVAARAQMTKVGLSRFFAFLCWRAPLAMGRIIGNAFQLTKIGSGIKVLIAWGYLQSKWH